MYKMTAGHHNSHYQHNYFYLSDTNTNNTPQNKEVWNDALHNYIVQGHYPMAIIKAWT